MIELFVFSLVIFGIAWGVGHSELSFPFRLAISKVRFGNVIIAGLECFGCLSWHLGWIAWLLHLAPVSALDAWWKTAFYAAATSLVLARLAGFADHPASEGGAFDRRGKAADP